MMPETTANANADVVAISHLPPHLQWQILTPPLSFHSSPPSPFRSGREDQEDRCPVGGGGGAVPLYVMTSPLNHNATAGYFTENGNFSINVTFFPQGTLPAMFPDGRMILESPTLLAVAPDGNGGVYPALVRHGILLEMRGRGIKYLHVFGVDNALVRPADPTFVGYCILRGVDCGNKVLWKGRRTRRWGWWRCGAGGRALSSTATLAGR